MELITSRKVQAQELDDLKHEITMQLKMTQRTAASDTLSMMATAVVTRVMTQAMAAVAIGSVAAEKAKLAERANARLMRVTFRRLAGSHMARALASTWMGPGWAACSATPMLR